MAGRVDDTERKVFCLYNVAVAEHSVNGNYRPRAVFCFSAFQLFPVVDMYDYLGFQPVAEFLIPASMVEVVVCVYYRLYARRVETVRYCFLDLPEIFSGAGID